MKKLVTFALAAILSVTAVSLAACDENGLPIDSVDIDSLANMTKDEWKELSAETNFENVTLDIWGAYVSGSRNVQILGEGKDIGTFKIDGDSGYGYEYYEENREYTMTADILSAVKNLYMGTALTMLENFEDFTYNEESQAFLSNKTIVYDVNIVSYDNLIATLTVQNVKVEVLPDGYLGKISCDMKQQVLEEKNPNADEYLQEEIGFEVDVKVVFSFREYGTTVLPTEANGNSSETDE